MIVESGDRLVEIVAGWIIGKNQRPDLGAQEMIGAGRAERGERRQRLRIDEFQNRPRIGEMTDLAFVTGNFSSDQRH